MSCDIVNEVIAELNERLSKHGSIELNLDSSGSKIHIKIENHTTLKLDMETWFKCYNNKEELIEMILFEINDRMIDIRSTFKIIRDNFIPLKNDTDNEYFKITNMFPEYINDEDSGTNDPVLSLVLVKNDIIKSIYSDYLYYCGEEISSIVSKSNYYNINWDDGFTEAIVIITDSLDNLSKEELEKVEIITVDSRFSDNEIMNVVNKCKNVTREFVNVC